MEDNEKNRTTKFKGFSVKEFIKKNSSSGKHSFPKLKKDQLLILFLVGVLLLVVSLPTEKKNGDTEDTEKTEDMGELSSGDTLQGSQSSGQSAYIFYLEHHLEEVLSQMEGVGDVTVMITLESSAEKVVEKDMETEGETVTETDSQGGSRTTRNSSLGESTVYSTDDSNEQVPYISKELSPTIEGVVVIADGGGDSIVKQNITEAVQALFGVDTHKIRVMKKSSK